MTDPPAWAPDGIDGAIDALGLRCPLPVLKLEAALRRAPPGRRYAIRTDDPVAAVDVPHAARSGGHACERISDAPCVFVVTRAPDDSSAPPRGV